MATNTRMYAQKPIKRQGVFSGKRHETPAKGVAARGRVRAIRRSNPRERRSFTRLNPMTFRTEGKLKKSVGRGLARSSFIRRLDARRQNDTRALIDSHARTTIMAPTEKTFNVDVDRCASRSRARDLVLASSSIDSRLRRSRSTDRSS